MLIAITDITEERLTEVFNLMLKEANKRFPGDSQRQIADFAGVPAAVFSRCKLGSESTSNIRRQMRKFAIKLNVSIEYNQDDTFSIVPRKVVTSSSDLLAGGTPPVYFIYHYVANAQTKDNRIGKALLKIEVSRKTASIFFYPRAHKRGVLPGSASAEKATPVPLVEYFGEISYHTDTTYLLFRNRKESGGEAQDIPALVCLEVRKGHLTSKSVILGSFATAGPAAGLTVLQRCPENEVMEQIYNNVVLPEIGKILVSKRFAKTRYQDKLLDYYRAEKFTKKVEEIDGRYLGFYLDSYTNSPKDEKRSDTDHNIIRVFDCFISEGHKIRYFNERKVEIRGYITKITDQKIHARLSYDYTTGQYETCFILNRRLPNRNDDVLRGTLAGTYLFGEEGGDGPVAGRVILVPHRRRRDESNPIQALIHLSSRKQMETLLSRFPYMLDFLSGNLDENYTDTRMVVTSKRLMQKWDKEPIKPKNPLLQKFAGLYLTYRLSSDRYRVYQRPVKIFADTGDVVRRIQYTEPGTHESLFGKIRVIRDVVLTLDFDVVAVVFKNGKPDKRAASRHTLIHTSKGKIDDGRAFQGVTTRLSGDNEPLSFREIFEPIKDTKNYGALIRIWTKDDLPEDPYRRQIVMSLIKDSDEVIVVKRK